MTSLEQRELDAIQAAFAAGTTSRLPAQIEPRNFSQPRHLSAGRLADLSRKLRIALDALVPELARLLRGTHKVSLAGLTEVDVASLMRGREAPFVLQGFTCGAELGWVLWEVAAAHCMAESVVTGSSQDVQGDSAKSLSRTEQRIVCELLDRVAGCCCMALGLAPKPGRIAQNHDELITLGIAPPDRNGRRLLVHLAFEGPGGPSDILVHLPGINEERAQPLPPAHDLPKHLDRVEVEVSACLGSIDVPLSQLLALELGDVIPLDADHGALVELFAEDRPCALASWGSYGSSLAVQIERIDEEFKELHPEIE